MLSFVPNSDVTLSFDMIHPDTSEVITPTAATYSVYDDEGAILVANQVIAVTGNETELSVTVLSADNDLGVATVGARTVVLNVTTATGVIQLSQSYVLELFGFLSVPAESGMTMPQAGIVRRGMAQAVLETWDYAEESVRQGALREAWLRIARFPFTPWLPHETPPDTVSSDIIGGRFKVSQLTAEDWAALPDHFKSALKRAQLIEACVILEGDPTWDRRQDGLISKTVGESSEMFSAKKAAMNSISPKAHREIRQYIRRSLTLGRA